MNANNLMGTAGISRGERKRMKTRSQLIEAAWKTAAGKSVDSVTVAEIANAADVGFGSFYNHFSSKDEIMEVAVSEFIEAHLKIFNDFFSLEEGDWRGNKKRLKAVNPEEFVAFGLRLIIKQAEEYPEWARFITNRQIFPKYADEIFYKRLEFFLEQGKKSKQFNINDVKAVGIYIGGATLQFLIFRAQGELQENAGEMLAELTLKMLGVEPARAIKIARLPFTVDGKTLNGKMLMQNEN